VAGAPSGDAIWALERRLAAASAAPGDLEREEEMLDGLRQLLSIAADTHLPIVTTQHRVIGSDVCHFVAPVMLGGEAGAAGKIFVTSARVILAAGRTIVWPHHRITQIVRSGRQLDVVAAGAADVLTFTCNTYGDALVAVYLISKLTRS
jgi:hypothetical protein